MTTCGICGKEFIGGNLSARYCSPECKLVAHKQQQKAHRLKKQEENRNRDKTKVCPICQKKFTPSTNQVYCSEYCKREKDNDRSRTIKKYGKKHKGFDSVMKDLKKQGIDYKTWKLEQAFNRVTPIILEVERKAK